MVEKESDEMGFTSWTTKAVVALDRAKWKHFWTYSLSLEEKEILAIIIQLPVLKKMHIEPERLQ